MHKLIVFVTLLVSSSVAFGACNDLQVETELKSKLSALKTEIDFSVAVERNDGKMFLFNKGSVTPDTKYKSASSAKLVTAVMILRMVDQGYLSLSDHPQKHIPSWPHRQSDPLAKITLRDLLSFTSGLQKDPLCLHFPRADFAECVLRIASRNSDPKVSPGKSFHYNSAHMQVAGLMAVKARKVTSWQDIFLEFKKQTGLFLSSTFDAPSEQNPLLAGGMRITAREYLTFLRHLKEGKLLTKKSMDELLHDHTGSSAVAHSPVRDVLSEDWHYGFGLWHECRSKVFNCTPGSRISSPGAFGIYPFWDRTVNYFGIVFLQGRRGTFPIGINIERSVREDVEKWANCSR